MNISDVKMNVIGKSTVLNGIRFYSPITLKGGELRNCCFTKAEVLNSVDTSKMTVSEVRLKTIPVFN